MRIELRRSGGFAGNIARPPLVVDTETLAPEDGRELEALADAALAAPVAAAPRGGADRSQLSLAVEHAGSRRTVAADEAAAPEELRALARRLRELS